MNRHVLAVPLAIGTLICGLSNAQDYPLKPVRIVAAESSGGGDVVARLIAQRLAPRIGQPVIVDNRGGPAGTIAAQTVARAAPDGYTLLNYSGTIWIVPLMRSNVGYDPVRDFTPITLAVDAPNVVVVHPLLPVRSIKDLIALAKGRRGELNYGTTGAGSTSHLASELFKSMAGVDIVSVPYKGTSLALNDLVSGQIQVMFTSPGGAMGHITSKRLRPLAVTTLQPSALMPGLPTVAATGLPGYESRATLAMLFPARTAPAIVSRMHQETVQVLRSADMREKLLAVGFEPVAGTPEQLAAVMTTDITRMSKLIKDAHIRAE